MTFVLAVTAGIAGAVVGYLIAAFAAMLYATAVGMSNFEGAAGMFAVFGAGPIGGLIGLILGIVLVLRGRSKRSFGAIALRGALAVVVIAALVAGGFGVMHLTRDVVNPNGAPPRLMFELRLPAGMPAPASRRDIEVELHTNRNTMPALLFDRSNLSDDRVVLPGTVDLYFRTSQRLLVIKRKGEPDRLFRLKLSANPGHMREQSAWQAVDFAAGPGEPSRKPGPADAYELRYRVAWAGED